MKLMIKRLREKFTDPLLTALTVMLALVIFAVAPLQASGILGVHNFGFALAIVIVAAVFIISTSWLTVALLLAALVLVALATVLRVRHPSTLDITFDASAWLIFGLTIIAVTARAVFAAGKVTYHRVIGAVLLYLATGVVFSALFCLVMVAEPGAFNGLKPLKDNLSVAANFIYFSFSSLTTVGYGDITPVHPLARGLANMEAVFGQLYPATLLARLVTLEIESRRDK